MVLIFPIANSAFADKDPTTLEVVLIYSTPNESCDMQEIEEAKIFQQSVKEYLNRFTSYEKILSSHFCTHIEEIKKSEFPLLLKSLYIQRPDLLIIVGDTEINEELVLHEDAFGIY